jgi:hypothetical protein
MHAVVVSLVMPTEGYALDVFIGDVQEILRQDAVGIMADMGV